MNDSPVVIVGAGYAGLVAASRLRAANVPFVIYEASASVAGLAATFKDMEGYSYDFGTHLITNRLASTLGIADQCRDVAYFGESVYLRGKSYSYPFGLGSGAALHRQRAAQALEPRQWRGARRSRLGRGHSRPRDGARSRDPADGVADRCTGQ